MRARHVGLTACALALVVALPACRGDRMARVELKGPGTAETKFQYAGKRIAVWADTDAKWAGSKNSKPEFTYEIEAFHGGTSVGRVTCATGDRGGGTSFCGSHSNIFGTHDADCEYLLACTLPALKPGEVTLRVTGTQGANVKAVKSMALNFRED